MQALLRRGQVTAEQVTDAERARQSLGARTPLWRALAGTRGVDRDLVFAQAAATYAFRIAPVAEREPEAEFVKTVMESFPDELREELIDLRAAPYAYAQDQPSGILKLVFITEDPMRPELQKAVNALELERFELCYAPAGAVDKVIEEAFPRKNEYLERLAEDSGADFDFGVSFESGDKKLVDEDALEAEIARSSLVNLAEAIFVESVRTGASDIHIWPNANRQTEVHFRTDGRLQHWHTEDRGHPEALLSVIKDSALNVDRFERDMAQDGFIQRKVDGTLIRYRVSILPIANANPELRAESIVIRVLDDRKVVTDLSKLGLLEGALAQFDKAIRQPDGMVILTGPTGSGKSTTLVAALSNVVVPEINVLTVEDPVEYIIPGVRQIKLSHKLSLEGALRAILRHDPDVVMVGEMRDKDTAELGVKLANTGHLTFSTLHTNDAPSAVSRLYKMGLEPFLIAYAINLIVAQRLIRGLCPDCKKANPDPDLIMARELGFSEEEIASTTFYEPNAGGACPNCKGRGYKGRRAVAEALYFSPAIRQAIVEAGDTIDEDGIRELAISEGMLTLQASARELVKRGDTSMSEMMRVTAGEH
ncbi:type II secretion system protein E [Rubricoccus marinus]|uniref:Type II secretion system protein E n=1 Tax=Rubricoccus marinus TaxID=716817 RepID=A0A259U3I8_9BACT|nr:type II secretion system protein E [Rubricoccus marinus]